MANKIIFNIDGNTLVLDRKFLEEWYTETNPYDYHYDHMKYELSKTSILDLAELYASMELAENGLSITYELSRDPEDIDVAENLKSEIKGIFEDLRWMLPSKEISGFLEELKNNST